MVWLLIKYPQRHHQVTKSNRQIAIKFTEDILGPQSIDSLFGYRVGFPLDVCHLYKSKTLMRKSCHFCDISIR